MHPSTLAKHRVASKTQRGKGADSAGVLALSTRKVAKKLMPSEVEQPNGYAMNMAVKDAHRWCFLNAHIVTSDGKDDHANLAFDVLYHKHTLLQATLTRKKGEEWELENTDFMPMADTHDYNTGPGKPPSHGIISRKITLTYRVVVFCIEARAPTLWLT